MFGTARFLACALVISVGLAGTAGAQTTAPLPPVRGFVNPPELDPMIKDRLMTVKPGERIKLGHFAARSQSGSATPQAVTALGWNYFHISYCYGFTVNHLDYLDMVFTDGSYTLSNDQTWLSAAGAICISSPLVGFNVTSISGNFFKWNELLVLHQ